MYVGKHSTDNINDGYLGSGTLLKKAIKKYGRVSFKIDILEFHEDEFEALNAEYLLTKNWML